MKHVIVSIVLITGISTTAQAGVCEDLSGVVERSLKIVSMTKMDLIAALGRGDSEISKLTSEITIGNEWQRININVQLMAQNKCTPLADATNYSRFSK